MARIAPAETSPDPFEFGIEQEMRNRIQYLAPSLVASPLFRWFGLGDPKRVDLLTHMAQATYLRKLREEAKKHPGEMVVEGNRVFYPKFGWGFSVGIDYTFLEAGLEPLTLEKLKAMREVLQRDLFDVPRRAGIRPQGAVAAGHVHIGLKNFGEDPVYFLNYIIDYVNHSELSNGGFIFDPVNAAPVIQDAKSREGFRRLLTDFDEGRVRTIDEIRDRLADLGMRKTPGEIQPAMNVKTRYPTIEMRAVRSYESVDHMIDFIELQDRRLNFLKGKEGRIEFLDVGPIRSAAQGAAQFRRYVEEAGGDWERFKKLVPERWRRVRPDFTNAFVSNPENYSFSAICRIVFGELLGI